MGKTNNGVFHDIFVAYSALHFKLRLNANLGLFSIFKKYLKSLFIDYYLCYMHALGGLSKTKIH